MAEDNSARLEMFLPQGMSSADFYIYLAAGAAFLATVSVGKMLMKRSDKSEKRLKLIRNRRAELQGDLVRAKRRRGAGKPESSVNFMRRVVKRFKLLKSQQAEQIQGTLIEAGLRSKDAIIIYLFFTLILPFVGLAIGLLVMQMDFWGDGKLGKFRIVSPILFLYLGFKFPTFYVNRKRKKRYMAVQRALSDTLDLMTICAEAGLSLSASLERVSRELGIAYQEMAEELKLTSIEMGFLPDRNKALLNLTERVKLSEVRGIVSVLIQTEKYGTPIAQALRVLSAEFREQRMLRAENKAARLPAMMTVPMILFILPTLFIVIISPAIIKIMDS